MLIAVMGTFGARGAWSIVALVAIATSALGGCRRDRAAPAERDAPFAVSVLAASATPTRAVPPAGSAPLPAVSSLGAAQASMPSAEAARTPIPCKAFGRRGFVSLGTLRESPTEMVARQEAVIVLYFEPPLARTTLTRIPRDGSPSVRLGRYTALGEPLGLVLDDHAAYFTQNKSIVRMNLDSGEATVLAKGVARVVALQGGSAYGISCDPKGSADRLLRFPTDGGQGDTVAEFTRPARARCDYRNLAVDGRTVFVGDWGTRRVLAVSLEDRSVRELATKKTFPFGFVVEPEQLVFQAAGGLYRVPRAGGDAQRLTELGSAPFFLFGADSSDFWLYDAEDYTVVQWLYRLPRSGGKPVKVDSFRSSTEALPNDIGIYRMAVDDQCLYLSRSEGDWTTILARQKPGPSEGPADATQHPTSSSAETNPARNTP